MGLLWPTRLKSPTTVLIRLGRVAHWIAAGISILATGIFVAIAFSVDEIDWSLAITSYLGYALVPYFVGRLVRYVLSGE